VSAGTRRGGWRLGITLVALVLAMAGLAASAAGVAAQILPRKFTTQQQEQIMAWEAARRWRTTPAGRMFPATVSYQLSSYGDTAASALPLVAYRVGISPQTSCSAASDPAAALVLSDDGCKAMLRATYTDGTDSMLVTVGVAVMPGPASARSAAARMAQGRAASPGLLPVAFPDTLASVFGTGQRQLSWAVSAGTYLVMSTVGYEDGRPQVAVSSDPYADEEMTSLAEGIASAVGTPLGAPVPAPRCPGAPGC
jgi:hypothetical protein